MKKAILTLLCLLAVQVSNAEIIKVNGEGATPIIKKDLNGTRNQAYSGKPLFLPDTLFLHSM